MQKSEKKVLRNLAFDHGYHVEFPIPLKVDLSKLNSCVPIRIAELLVLEINELLKAGGSDIRMSWKKNPKPEKKVTDKNGKPAKDAEVVDKKEEKVN